MGQQPALRAALLDPCKPYIKSGPVCLQRAASHNDGIHPRPLRVNMGTGDFAGQPLPFAQRRGEVAVLR